MNKILLFSQESLRSFLEGLKDSIRKEINSFSSNDFKSSDFELRISALATKYSLHIPILLEDKIEFKDKEIQMEVNSPFGYPTSKKKVKGIQYTFIVPFKGDSRLFTYRTMEFSSGFLEAIIDGSELLFNYNLAQDEKIENVKHEFAGALRTLNWYLERVKKEVGVYNQEYGNIINSAVRNRREQIEKQNQLGNELGYKRRED
jgi:hypothetical protein